MNWKLVLLVGGIATWERRTCEIKRAFGARDENNEQRAEQREPKREREKGERGWVGARMHNRDMDRARAADRAHSLLDVSGHRLARGSLT